MNIYSYRSNGGPQVMLNCQEVTFEQAIEKLVKWELKFGGLLSKCSDKKVNVTTRVLGCVDDTEFEGTEEEIKTLLEICTVWEDAADRVNRDKLTDELLNLAHGNALLATSLAPILLGNYTAQKIVEEVNGTT